MGERAEQDLESVEGASRSGAGERTPAAAGATTAPVGKARRLVAAGAPPADVADILRTAPGERTAIVGMLQQVAGNGYVQQVFVELAAGDGSKRIDEKAKPAFLAQLRTAIEHGIEGELGREGATSGCPYLEKYFTRYASAPVAVLDAVIDRWVPGASGALTMAELIPLVVARVLEATKSWQQTGQVPADLLAADPEAAPPDKSASGAPTTLAAMEHQLGPGQALDAGTEAKMSAHVGADVSGARIHTGGAAAAMASANNAAAFAVGNNIVMGSAAPAPGSLAGDALLAHELAHTAQQKHAATDPTARHQPIGAEGEAAERDAGVERLARLGTFSGALGDVMRTGLQLQRCPQSEAMKGPPMSGAQADKFIENTSEISGFIKGDLEKGIDGAHAVQFHDDMESYVKAWRYDSIAVPSTWAPHLDAAALDKLRWDTARELASAPGFTNYETHKIHIYTKGTPAFVTIHEVVHLHTDKDVYARMGDNFVEGLADYYAGVVCAKNHLPFFAAYDEQAKTVAALERQIGNDNLAALAFAANIEGAQAIVDTKAPGTWKQFTKQLKAGEYKQAREALEGVKDANDAHLAAAQADRDKSDRADAAKQEAAEAAERKTWPKEASAPIKGRVISYSVIDGKMRYSVGLGGANGVRDNWTAAVPRHDQPPLTAPLLHVGSRMSTFELPLDAVGQIDMVELDPRAHRQ